MRYVGQEHAVTVDLPIELFKSEDRDGIKQRFDAVHQTRYGFSVAEREGRDRQPAQRRDRPDAQAARSSTSRRATPSRTPAAFRGKRPVYFASDRLRRHADLSTAPR